MRDLAHSANGGTQSRRGLKVLVTAAEAYPEFERAVLGAQREIVMGFRIFDPRTRLRSAEGKAVGADWCDLLAHALARGVRVELNLGDFDPLMATDLHQCCWGTMRALAAVRELAGPGAAPLVVRPLLHPAAVAPLPRLLFWPLTAMRLRRKARELRGLPADRQDRARAEMPGLCALEQRREVRPIPLFPVSHHQKIAVIDERWVYVGGLDLDERRWDDRDHDLPAQETWHDVQVLLDDPDLARSARAHLESLPDVTAGRADPPAAPGLLRTLSRPRRRASLALSPKNIVRELRDEHYRQLRKAQRLIYLETQFFRDRRLARRLAARARAEPDLKLILVLPGAPEVVAFAKVPPLDGRFGDFLQTRCLLRLRRAFGDRLLIASPVQARQRNGEDTDAARAALRNSPLIYLHSKVSIFDDRAAIVSSANLNGRSLKWDTETGVALTDPDEVAALRRRVLETWLTESAPAEARDPATAFEHWRDLVWANAERAPDQRHGFLVPYDIRAARATALPMPGAPEEMV